MFSVFFLANFLCIEQSKFEEMSDLRKPLTFVHSVPFSQLLQSWSKLLVEYPTTKSENQSMSIGLRHSTRQNLRCMPVEVSSTYYLRGGVGKDVEDDEEDATWIYHAAVEKDPTDVEAMAGLGRAYADGRGD